MPSPGVLGIRWVPRTPPCLRWTASFAAAAALLAGVIAGCGSEPSEDPPTSPVIVLGFDGLDPDRVEHLWEAGQLPNLKKLAAEGSFHRLRSTTPPLSAVAWSSFATGTLPGQHGVFDFVGREPKTYALRMGATRLSGPRYHGDRLAQRPEATNQRRGMSFWLLAARAGKEAYALNVPYTYPPEAMPRGGHAPGVGVPDLRGTNSTSTFFSSDREGPSPGGVDLVPTVWSPAGAEVAIQGPMGPGGQRSVAKLQLKPGPRSDQLEVTWTAGSVSLRRGEWSPWILVDFPLGSEDVARGQLRLHLQAIGPDHIQLYASAVGARPEAPFFPLTHPETLAAELQEAAGRYHTVGWEQDTSVVNGELQSDAVFLAEAFRILEQRTQQVEARLRAGIPDLLVAVWTGPDRISHLFWRNDDPKSPRYPGSEAVLVPSPVDEVYRRVDQILGRIRALLPPEALLLIVSDHGFHPFLRQVHINRWLIENGYLVLQGGVSEVPQFFEGVDWSKSRAYALGTGQVFVNLKGREGQGIVEFGPERAALLLELRAGLLSLRDPESGEAVLVDALSVEEAFAGPASAGAPDLQLAFASGYQISWATRLGGAPLALIDDNPRKWSGDHAASASQDSHGLLLSSFPLAANDPGIEDLAPTVLRALSLSIGPEVGGHPLIP